MSPPPLAEPSTTNQSDVVSKDMPATSSSSDLPDNPSPKQAAAWAGYRNVAAFLATARATGLRIFYINERVLRIDRKELIAWRNGRSA